MSPMLQLTTCQFLGLNWDSLPSAVPFAPPHSSAQQCWHSGATDEESSTNLRGDPPDVRIPMMLTKVRRIQMGCHRNQIPLAILSES